jgi:hypothetical protein
VKTVTSIRLFRETGQNIFTSDHIKDFSERARVFKAEKDIFVLMFKCKFLKRMARELTIFWCIATGMLVH